MAAKRKTQPAVGRRAAGRRAADSAERAYIGVRQWIIEFKLKSVERVNELQLAETLALSRTPVREALTRPASEGLRVFAANRGFLFRSLDTVDLAVSELRPICKRGSIELSCRRASMVGITALARFWTNSLVRFRRGDPDEMLRIDDAFHHQLAELSGHGGIVRRIATIQGGIRFARRFNHDLPRQCRVTGHTRIVAALKARNAGRGRHILAQHISHSVEDVQRVLNEVLLPSM